MIALSSTSSAIAPTMPDELHEREGLLRRRRGCTRCRARSGPPSGTSSRLPTTMPGSVPPSPFSSATDCQNCSPAFCCTLLAQLRRDDAVAEDGADLAGRSDRSRRPGRDPGSRRSSVLPDDARARCATVELMRLCSDAAVCGIRGVEDALRRARSRCSTPRAHRSSCVWKRFDATLNEMYSPMTRIASAESASVMSDGAELQRPSPQRGEAPRQPPRHERGVEGAGASAADIRAPRWSRRPGSRRRARS